MKFQRYTPSLHLQPTIAYYWTLESEDKDDPDCTCRMVPDGYVDWIFHLKAPWSYYFPKKK